jgi:hypothetical protein
MKFAAILLAIVSTTVSAEQRIMQTDSIGNGQYHKPQYVARDGKIYQSDSIGNPQYHKGSLTVVKTAPKSISTAKK